MKNIWKILLIVLVFVAFIILIYFLSRPKPMNKFTFPDTVVVNNYTEFEIDTIDLDYSKPDHIHLLVRSVPKLSQLQIVRVLKQQTNYWAWQNYETYLKQVYWKSHHLWTRGYFCSSVGNVSADTVHEYLERQGRNEC